jgi:ADP-ribose pyrophosphatase YjhB (NUDIX family)
MANDSRLRGPSVRGIPEGDNRERMICADCGYILYDNPKIVVGSVPRWGERILLCRRSIEPRYGFWTLPAGYLELNESASAGAEREAWEEANARIEIEGLLHLRHSAHQPGTTDLSCTIVGRCDIAGTGKPRSRALRLGRHSLVRSCLSINPLGAAART